MGLSFIEFVIQLAGIVVVDITLGGDNAIVIGMACRNLPQGARFKGIVFGTIGAVAVRAAATIVFVGFMNLPYIKLIGGVVLVLIGCKLLVGEDSKPEIKPASSLCAAVANIIVADAIMGIDNVLAIASVTHGHKGMVIVGLCISVPIVVFGSALIIKLLDRFSFILYIGAAVILYAAAKMIADEPIIEAWLTSHEPARWLIVLGVTAGGLVIGYLLKRKKSG
jgi:YjbE family integral membrane protein